ncbi:hypothetical protein LWI28_012093 [Acer negundo]|uniref:Uncharacterized protein n=1 Tax=Acer negundo TaxID=4023 RepID=A0AAD5J4K1_ACENE|nr:hypothetical protein LWI28_012093 [Acer negundo]
MSDDATYDDFQSQGEAANCRSSIQECVEIEENDDQFESSILRISPNKWWSQLASSGVGNPWTFRALSDLKRNFNPDVLLPMETKAKNSLLESYRHLTTYLQEELNKSGETPEEVFSREHKDLVEKGGKWMRDTATSCSVVAALIITIVFSRWKQHEWNPQLLERNLLPNLRYFNCNSSVFFYHFGENVLGNAHVALRRKRFPRVIAEEVDYRANDIVLF